MMRKKAICSIIMAFCLIGSLFPSSLIGELVERLSPQEVIMMASSRNMDVSGDVEDIRRNLLESLNVEEKEESVRVETSDQVSFQIVSADRASVTQEGLMVLEGGVVVSIDDEMRLSASRMTVDLESSKVSAIGNVTFSDSSSSSSVSQMNGDAVFLDFDDSSLLVSGGYLFTSKKDKDGKDLEYYTTGESIRYLDNGGIFIDHGSLVNSPKNYYSSIDADAFHLLPNGDIYMENATLKVGRVPMFYLPFMFMPGARMTGNPSMGLSSERGMFLNTTFEIFGCDENIEVSKGGDFTTLLASDTRGYVPDGIIYRDTDKEKSGVQKWADESDSFLSIKADAYEKSGISAGLTARLNFPGTGIGFTFDSALALSKGGVAKPVGISDYRTFRYYALMDLSVRSKYVTLSADIPIYSDPTVLRLFGNRNTSFTLESLFGARQKFPSDFSSDKSSFDMTLSGRAEVPTGIFGKYLKKLAVTDIRSKVRYRWNNGRYEVQSFVLPEMRSSASGSLFDFSFGRIEEKPEEEIPSYSSSIGDMKVIRDEVHHGTNTMSMNWSVSNRFIYELFDDGRRAEMHSDTSGSLDFRASFDYGILDVRQTLVPTHVYGNRDAVSQNFNLRWSSTVSVPALGVTHSFDALVYSLDQKGDDFIEKTFRFDRDNVRKHSISLSRAFGESSFRFTPQITFSLPPMDMSISPRLSFRWKDLNWGISYRIEDVSGYLKGVSCSTDLGYSNRWMKFSTSVTYNIKDKKDAYDIRPLSARYDIMFSTSDRKYSMDHRLSYSFSQSAQKPWFDGISFTLNAPWASLSYSLNGAYDDIRSDVLRMSLKVPEKTFYFWKNRIGFMLKGNLGFDYHFEDRYSTQLSYEMGMSFSIAEFIDIDFAVSGGNSSFYRYFDEMGHFSFPLLGKDLMRSFDIFGDGVRSTGFNMRSVKVDMVHHMVDWDLNVSYRASVSMSGGRYCWVPSFSVFLSWKSLSEIKIDQQWEKIGGVHWEKRD